MKLKELQGVVPYAKVIIEDDDEVCEYGNEKNVGKIERGALSTIKKGA